MLRSELDEAAKKGFDGIIIEDDESQQPNKNIHRTVIKVVDIVIKWLTLWVGKVFRNEDGSEIIRKYSAAAASYELELFKRIPPPF